MKLTKAKLSSAASMATATALYGSQAIRLIDRIKEHYGNYQESKYYSIKVSDKSNGEFYGTVIGWLYDQGDFSAAKTFEALPLEVVHEENTLQLIPNGGDQNKFSYGGFDYLVSFSNGEEQKTDIMNLYRSAKSSVLIKCLDSQGLDFLRKTLEEVYYSEIENKKVYVPASYGEFRALSPLPMRSLDSVILRDGQIEAVIADIEKFYASEKLYEHNGFPYHRCYLLYGPPGSGKTSLVKALAYHFHKDLYCASLKAKKETDLINLVGEVKRNFLLLEDIDSYHIAVDRTESKDMASTSSLLNALDGVTTPTGLVTFMTTNHIKKLDPALLREGRVDLKIELGFLDLKQLNRMFSRYYGEDVHFGSIAQNITPAKIAEIFKTNEGSDTAVKAILDLGVEL